MFSLSLFTSLMFTSASSSALHISFNSSCSTYNNMYSRQQSGNSYSVVTTTVKARMIYYLTSRPKLEHTNVLLPKHNKNTVEPLYNKHWLKGKTSKGPTKVSGELMTYSNFHHKQYLLHLYIWHVIFSSKTRQQYYLTSLFCASL